MHQNVPSVSQRSAAPTAAPTTPNQAASTTTLCEESTHAVEGEQVYFSLSSVYRAPRRKYISEVTGLVVYSRDELQFLNCVCVDIDLAHNEEQFDFDAQVQQVLDFTLTAGLPYPSMVSDSGRGIWLFWLLKDRLNPGPPTAHNNLQLSHSNPVK